MDRLFWIRFCLLLFMCVGFFAYSHEGHHHLEGYTAVIQPPVNIETGGETLSYRLWKIGRLHFLFVHFPIALIIMTIIAESLSIWFQNPLFDHAARFMIVAAALFVIPTVLLGWALSYGQTYEGLSLELFQWHRYFGLITAGLTIFAAIMRERYVRRCSSSLAPYYVCLFLLFLCINLTGTFGGSLAFGIESW